MSRNKWVEDNLQPEIAESSIFRFNVTIGSGENAKNVTLDMFSNTDIDFADLEQQIMDTPSQYAFWSGLYSEVKLAEKILEKQVRQKKGRLTEAIVDTYVRQGGKPPAAELVNRMVDKDKALSELEVKYMIVQKNAGKLWFMIQAVQMRMDAMRSLMGLKRQEHNSSK